MTTTETSARYFGKCVAKGCKYRVVTEGATAGPSAPPRCPDHVWSLDWRPLASTLNPEKECNGRCMGAVGPACDCSCGGENHGTAHL